MKKIIFIGAGGHAESVADSLDRNNYILSGFIDSHKSGEHMCLPIYGKDIKDIPDFRSFLYFVTIGDAYYRKSWFNKIKEMGLESINIIDRSAVISSSVKMGTGNFVGKQAIINAGSVLGDNIIINTRALVEHQCNIASHVHISTNSIVNGDVTVEESVFFGSCAVCNGQLTIGHHSIVGSGSVVVRNVEPWTTVVGVPAKIIKRRSPDD